MVYPQFPDHQPPIVPWPSEHGGQDHKGSRRSPVLTASLAALIAVLVLAVGLLLGLQLSRSDSVAPLRSNPSPSVIASPQGAATPTTSSVPAAREPEPRRASDSSRLDRSTYQLVSARDFALMAKNPDSWTGRKIIVYGVVTQFDAATGPATFRADTGSAREADSYDYDQNTFVTAHDAHMVANIVEKDRVTMYVEVQGAYTYDTQIGGSTTVPSVLVNIIEPTSSSSPRPSLPTADPLPASVPGGESASDSQLRSIAASDQPFILSGLADRWVPQLSSKRLGMVAEGRTWTNAMILNDHLRLRNSYPGVRLLWSGGWSTFSDSDFWITIAGAGFPTADQALAWCTSSGFDRDHCYAKLISDTHPVEGSTAYNK